MREFYISSACWRQNVWLTTVHHSTTFTNTQNKKFAPCYEHCKLSWYALLNYTSPVLILIIWSVYDLGFNVLLHSSSPLAAWGLLWLARFSALGRRGLFKKMWGLIKCVTIWRWQALIKCTVQLSHTLSKSSYSLYIWLPAIIYCKLHINRSFISRNMNELMALKENMLQVQ